MQLAGLTFGPSSAITSETRRDSQSPALMVLRRAGHPSPPQAPRILWTNRCQTRDQTKICHAILAARRTPFCGTAKSWNRVGPASAGLLPLEYEAPHPKTFERPYKTFRETEKALRLQSLEIQLTASAQCFQCHQAAWRDIALLGCKVWHLCLKNGYDVLLHAGNFQGSTQGTPLPSIKPPHPPMLNTLNTPLVVYHGILGILSIRRGWEFKTEEGDY